MGSVEMPSHMRNRSPKLELRYTLNPHTSTLGTSVFTMSLVYGRPVSNGNLPGLSG
jgi:hypothetical protein